MILSELARQLECELVGDGEVDVRRVAPLDAAGNGDLSFATGPKYARQLGATAASAVIRPSDLPSPLPSLLSDNPYLTFARAVSVLHPDEKLAPGVHPTAVVDPSARLGPDVHVGALAVVGAGVSIGARTAIHAHAVVYPEVTIGEDCVLHSGVQVRERCELGARVVVQNGAVLGADGFGFAKGDDGRYEKILHLGRLVLEDDVEIGALTAIDRASLGETRIGRGTKIDNLVQVGHSVSIGPDSVLAGQVGIAGSTRIGARVMLAGQVGIAGHIEVGDDVIATAQTGIPSSIEAGRIVSGAPALDNRRWLRATAVFGRLPELQRRVRELERQLAALRETSTRASDSE